VSPAAHAAEAIIVTTAISATIFVFIVFIAVFSPFVLLLRPLMIDEASGLREQETLQRKKGRRGLIRA
jgi:hypothetical protein